uniref:Uncharacterized protein n=1 Tax=Arundo donax TaxID=35708 RepID=A0A0A9QHZ5_ARUDO
MASYCGLVYFLMSFKLLFVHFFSCFNNHGFSRKLMVRTHS